MNIRHIAALGLLAGFSAAQAQTIFSDNFNADLLGLNKTTFVGGWTVGSGTVDVIGAGPAYEAGAGPGQAGDATGYNFFPGRGNFVDLDGSSNQAGLFSKALTLTANTTYTASFALAGSQRNFFESVDVMFGSTAATYVLNPTSSFSNRTLTFTPTSTGVYTLWFSDRISNLEGPLLDNVTVAAAAVPEPSTYGLMLAGLVGIGFVVRRRLRD